MLFKPKMIICGYSAYPRDLDYQRFRKIADLNQSYLVCDMAHFSGFVATGELKNPFDHCDVVMTTTHKTLRGPRAAMIFYQKEYEIKINHGVFPGLQGGPHENQIAAIATQLKEVSTLEFKQYIQQVKKNAKVLAKELMILGYDLCTEGTDNHLILVNLRKHEISGSKIEKICELVNISINKNSIIGDKSAFSPSGIRLGTSSITTRGFIEEDVKKIARFLNQCISLAIIIQNRVDKMINGKEQRFSLSGIKFTKIFISEIDKSKEVKIIKQKIIDLSKRYPLYP